jgi:hypothetical protein
MSRQALTARDEVVGNTLIALLWLREGAFWVRSKHFEGVFTYLVAAVEDDEVAVVCLLEMLGWMAARNFGR